MRPFAPLSELESLPVLPVELAVDELPPANEVACSTEPFSVSG